MLKNGDIEIGRIYVTADDRIVRCYNKWDDHEPPVLFLMDSECNMKAEKEEATLRPASIAEERDFYRAAYFSLLNDDS